MMCFTGKPVLYIVAEANSFHAGRWLKDISAKHLWEQIWICWIDTCLEPPDFIISSKAEKPFMARGLKQVAINMRITIQNVPVEAHHSIY